MDIQKYLKGLIYDKSDYKLSNEDKKTILHEGLGQFIFNKLNSSKFRAQATEANYSQSVKNKIQLSINHNLPIHLTLPFGATKNPYLPTAPGVDWAEVCNLAYLRQYLSPIAKAYKYGVILHYISVSIFEEKVNRIPQKDVKSYDTQFAKLVKFYGKLLPKNLKVKFTRVADEIPQTEINRQLTIKIAELQKNWFKLDPKVREYKLLRAKRNVVIKPGDKHIDKIILNAVWGHDAFCSECWTYTTAPWDKKDMITLGHNYTNGWAVHVRSTPGSSVNFWSGIGILEKRGDTFLPTVLSPLQFVSQKQNIKNVSVKLFDKLSPNLKTIPVLKK
jgi:hypothetical protein